VVVDHHVDGRSLRLQTATTTRLAFGWSWRMAQVVPPQYEVGQGSEIRNSVRGSKEIWECLGVMTLRSLWFALLGTTLNMWECPP
jgi:hypothetical protein